MTLAGAGVPVDTVTLTSTSAIVTYMPWATQAQQNQGAAIVAAFDWSEEAQQVWDDKQQPDKAGLRDNAEEAIFRIDSYLSTADTATTAQMRQQVKALSQIQRRVILRLLQLSEAK